MTQPQPAAADLTIARDVIAHALLMERLHQPLMSGPQRKDFHAADRAIDALAANGLIITAAPPSGQVSVPVADLRRLHEGFTAVGNREDAALWYRVRDLIEAAQKGAAR